MRLLVLGAGVSGRAAAGLAARLGHQVTLYDRNAIPDAGGLATVSGEWDPLLLTGVELVVTSPGIPERAAPITDTVEAGIDLISEVEFAWRHLDAPTVGITGTNGKTTVTELVSRMLGESGLVAPPLGNIGAAASDAVGDALDVAVLELSSFQLRFCDTLRCRVAVVTNAAEDHMDWHGSVAGYHAAKARIVANQEEGDTVVYDASDPGAAAIAVRSEGARVGVSVDGSEPLGVVGDRLEWGGACIPLDRLGVGDPAYLTDLALAGVAALGMGGSPEAVVDVAAGFRPGAHRRSLVAEIDGVRYVDDSKATNPHAALAAIAAFGSVVLIAGGLAKGLDLAPLASADGVRAVVAIGGGKDVLLDAARAGGPAESMEEAVHMARLIARPGDVVLLAPGTASFDMFDSYAARGDAFAAAVRSEEQ